MNNKILKTDILVVGGGPVGLAVGLELGYQGIDCIVIDDTNGEVDDPKVSSVGVRTMEFCRRWGIAQQIKDAGWSKEHTLDVAWVTSVGGHEIYRVPFPSYAKRPQPSYTPESDQVCPQNWFAPIFQKSLGLYPDGSLLLNSRLESFTQDDKGIVAKVKYVDRNENYEIHAQYLVACDGARSQIRKACNIDAPTFHPTQVFQSIVFTAPKLAEQLGEKNAMVFYLVNPTLQEPLRAVDGRGSYRLIAKPHEDGTMRDPVEAIKAAITIDTPFEVISNLQWRLTHRVADSFRQGRIFLGGDAAHTLSPSGGFGMNTGIGDAVDIAWKLAAVIKGWGGVNLLDTYERDRRPIAVRNLQQANANLERSQKRGIPPFIMTDSPEAREIRASMAQGMERSGVKREFDAPGIHLGIRYESDIVLIEKASDEEPPKDDPFEWKQSTYPGMRAPHVWLEDGKSTLDLFGHGFVLMCFKKLAGIENLEKICQEKGVPLTVHLINNPEIAKVYEKSYVLVRPDGHVAWRGENLPSNLDIFIDKLTGN